MGKTIVTAAIAALARAAGRGVAVVKPAQTGVSADDPGNSDIPDIEMVTRLSGVTDTHELARFPDPLSPEAAARVSGLPPLDVPAAADYIAKLAAERDLVLVEEPAACWSATTRRAARWPTWRSPWRPRSSSSRRPAWAPSTTPPSPARPWPLAASPAPAWSSAAGRASPAWPKSRTWPTSRSRPWRRCWAVLPERAGTLAADFLRVARAGPDRATGRYPADLTGHGAAHGLTGHAWRQLDRAAFPEAKCDSRLYVRVFRRASTGKPGHIRFSCGSVSRQARPLAPPRSACPLPRRCTGGAGSRRVPRGP